MTSVLLIGWATGGLIFGKIADRVGRTKTLLLTMLLYSVGTAACAAAPNLWVLLVFRVLASVGIGGEWAAGAAMVAEVVPEKRRVEAGALLYTSAPFGLFLATFFTLIISRHFMAGQPQTSWRVVLLCGLLPAAVALLVRLFVKEPERWQGLERHEANARIGELFTPKYIRITLSGFLMALVALVTWWSCNAFIPVVASGLAQTEAAVRHLDRGATLALTEGWKALATNCFNWGGLLGTLLTVPAAKYLGRKQMFFVYFLLSGVALLCAFGLPLDSHTRLYMYFPIGLTVFGVFGSFTFYLPELFPTRLRATGAGFCYNVGRYFAAIGPFVVGSVAAGGPQATLRALFCVGFLPLIGLLALPWVIETKGRALQD
jgi:MFS family permease